MRDMRKVFEQITELLKKDADKANENKGSVMVIGGDIDGSFFVVEGYQEVLVAALVNEMKRDEDLVDVLERALAVYRDYEKIFGSNLS